MFRASTSPTILVIDDDEGVTQAFARMLQVDGYVVRTAASGETGLWAVEECHPDAILLDLRMPVVDGLEFLRRLRTADTQTRVAVVTGDYSINREEGMGRELCALGAELVFKPVGREDLLALARRLCA